MVPSAFRSRLAGFLAVLLLTVFGAVAAEAMSREARAEALYRRGVERFTLASADSQRAALEDLEEAARLAPRRKDVWLALGKACLESGRTARGRSCLSRLVRMGGDDFETWFTLGEAWKGDWLRTVERVSLDKASHCYDRATRVAPDRAEGWTAAASIALLRGQARDAALAAGRARLIDLEGREPALVAAAALYRLGLVTEADSAFRFVRARFSDGWLESFRWEGTDPDLTTSENEAELDGLTRWALARFLFREGDRVRWDQRAELFVRYGPPAHIELDPVWAALEFVYPRHAKIMYAPDPIPFSFHMQVWHYPQLGINAVLWDRSLRYSYDFPYANDRSMDPVPDLALVDSRADLIALDGGRGVFRALPPGAEPLSLKAIVNRFPTKDAMSVVTHLFSPGTPAESLWGSWAVADEHGRVVHRDSGPLSVSACDPAGEQLIEFATVLPPGDYRVDVAVRKGSRGRGVAHLGIRVNGPPGPLVMSDLVLVCDDALTSIGAAEVRLSPNVEKHIDDPRSVAFYYELEGLGLGEDGQGRFSYTCTVHPIERLGKEATMAAVYQATREEENAGTHRRQFVTVPVSSLGPGYYEARVRVKDLVTGAETVAAAQFSKGYIPAAERDRSRPPANRLSVWRYESASSATVTSAEGPALIP
ncbi:MAG TPA: tetratricopeptide repeat protein [Candidatus Eisenbacteria bacterium]|nr:tetratricopeptide repeat protein [Candidatus Eisenbacteria bacterium]